MVAERHIPACAKMKHRPKPPPSRELILKKHSARKREVLLNTSFKKLPATSKNQDMVEANENDNYFTKDSLAQFQQIEQEIESNDHNLNHSVRELLSSSTGVKSRKIAMKPAEPPRQSNSQVRPFEHEAQRAS